MPLPPSRPPGTGFVADERKKDQENRREGPRRLAGWPWAARMTVRIGAAEETAGAIIKGENMSFREAGLETAMEGWAFINYPHHVAADLWPRICPHRAS